MELIRYKVKGDTVMGILFSRELGVYYTIEKLGKMIPEGTHFMKLTYSPKFKKELPFIWSDSVPKNRGIRIHNGNSVKSTDGCILIGNTADLTLLKIGSSVPAVAQLVKAMKKTDLYFLYVKNAIR